MEPTNRQRWLKAPSGKAEKDERTKKRTWETWLRTDLTLKPTFLLAVPNYLPTWVGREVGMMIELTESNKIKKLI